MKNDIRIIDHPLLEVERGDQITIYFNSKPKTAYTGETIAAALYAAGVRLFSRSFKYHRPRGLFCLSGHCSHCMMRVDGVPNVRTCMEPVRQGMRVESQNAWPNLNFDIAALSGYMDFFIRPGFQYRHFKSNRALYHLWEKFLRKMAGIGSLPETVNPSKPRRIRVEPEVVIVGSGVAGLSATLHAAQSGADTWLIEKESNLGGRLRYDTTTYESLNTQKKEYGFSIAKKLEKKVEVLKNCRVLKGATAFAWYDEEILAVVRPGEFWELKPQRVIIATGSYENPMVFENNDLPGIFLSGGVQRLMHHDFLRPGKRAVVATNNDRGYAIANQLLSVDIQVAAIIDSRHEMQVYAGFEAKKAKEASISIYSKGEIKAAFGLRRVKGTMIRFSNGYSSTKVGKLIKTSCDVLCIAGSRSPANELVFQRTCQGTYVLESPHQYTRRPLTDSNMQVGEDMYVAGAANGNQIVEQSLLEGKIAGLSAAIDLGYGDEENEAAREQAKTLLNSVKT